MCDVDAIKEIVNGTIWIIWMAGVVWWLFVKD